MSEKRVRADAMIGRLQSIGRNMSENRSRVAAMIGRLQFVEPA